MKLTPELQTKIENMTHQEVLSKIRFAPIGDTLFQGESGEFVMKRLQQLRDEPGGAERHTAASKAIGW
jgi:hypothetical protein